MVKDPADYEWSSHNGYTPRAKKWDWLYKGFLLSIFSEKSSEAKKAYIEFVLQKEPEEIETFYAKKNLPSVLGDDAFKDWITEKFQDFRFHREIPESHILAPAPEKIIDLVSKVFKVKRESLTKFKRGTENVPRDIAVYLLRIYSKQTYFNITNYSTVSSIVERIKVRKLADKAIGNKLKQIEKKLGKGQKQT